MMEIVNLCRPASEKSHEMGLMQIVLKPKQTQPSFQIWCPWNSWPWNFENGCQLNCEMVGVKQRTAPLISLVLSVVSWALRRVYPSHVALLSCLSESVLNPHPPRCSLNGQQHYVRLYPARLITFPFFSIFPFSSLRPVVIVIGIWPSLLSTSD